MQTGVSERRIEGPQAGRRISFCCSVGEKLVLVWVLLCSIFLPCSASNYLQELSFLHCSTISLSSSTYSQQCSWVLEDVLEFEAQFSVTPVTSDTRDVALQPALRSVPGPWLCFPALSLQTRGCEAEPDKGWCRERARPDLRWAKTDHDAPSQHL